jgi:two-component system OmpR family response regulator
MESLERSKMEIAPGGRPLILIIEDEPEMAREISEALGDLGYDIKIVDTLEAGYKAARSEHPSLMIVDRILRGLDSITMIETIRSEGISIPVLFVSALSSVDERILGLKAGGDDYIPKPFTIGELEARVEALLRRAKDPQVTILRVGPLKLDLIERRAMRGQRLLSLLPREFKLLEYFVRHPNQVITRTMLFENVWNYKFEPQTPNLADVHIGKLRRKVDGPGEPPLIQTVRGVGFRLHAPD